MATISFHYNSALNGYICDASNSYTPQSGALKSTVLPAYFHLDAIYPPHCAKPVYGFIVPLLALLVITVNLLIIIIFSKPHIRSHTTFILTIIAISDSLNIAIPSILYVHYYTLDKHNDYVPFNLCFITYVSLHLLPDLFNLISVWSTILLACIRFRCLQSPFRARELHTNRRIAIGITFVVIIALFVHLPTVVMFDFIPANVTSFVTNETMKTCVVATAKALNKVCAFREIHIWIELFANSFIPCFTLIALDIAILCTLRKAAVKRLSLHTLGSAFQFSSRRKSSVTRYKCLASKTKENISKSYIIDGKALQQIECNESAHNTEEFEFNTLTKRITTTERRQSNSTCDGNHTNTKDNSLFAEGIRDIQHLRQCSHVGSNQQSRLKRFSSLFVPSSLIWERRSTSIHHCQSNKTKHFRHSRTFSDVSYKKLARESKRTSWMIFAVVALICSYELLYGILFAYKMIHNVGPIPVNFFGCGTVYLYLWQYITYPLIFLIYCFMSAAFRHELKQSLCCSTKESKKLPVYGRNSVFMSPCSVRKSLSLSSNDKAGQEELMEEEV